MPAPPLVSVLIPAYNAGTTLGASVRSALAQTMVDLEVIVVDDGSAIPVTRTLAEIGDGRLRILTHVTNQGVSAARNTGLAAARGQFIAQLDADDLWDPDHLRTALARFEDPQVGLVYADAEISDHPAGQRRWIDDPAAPAGRGAPGTHPVRDLDVLYAANPIPAVTAVMRIDAVRSVGGYPTWLTVGEDYLLYIRLLRAGWRFAYVPRASALYRWPDASRGATFDRRRTSRQQVRLFGLLWLRSPWEPALQHRLLAELKDLLTSHVPATLALWRRWQQMSGRRA